MKIFGREMITFATILVKQNFGGKMKDITKQLKNLKDSFGEPIAVALIVDHGGVSIRKARKLGPHLLGEKEKTEAFSEEEMEDIGLEAIPDIIQAPKGKTKYIG
jgi:hypothetical protein